MGGRVVHEGLLAGRRLVLSEAGIGKVNAATHATRLIDRFQPHTVIFTGVAGGLDEDLHVGDVVVGELTIQHDAGVIENEALRLHQAGHVPFFNPSDRLGFRPTADLLARARLATRELRLEPIDEAAGGIAGRVPKVVFGTILTGDQFVNCEATRRRLRADLGAMAVEMEGAAVAQVCEESGIDCLVIRSLSDLAGTGSDIDFLRFLDQVAVNSIEVVKAIVRRIH